MIALLSNASKAQMALPPRYLEPWKGAMDSRIADELRPNIRILDIGSGRTPVLEREARPPGCFYAGLDLSERELQSAPPGSYDAMYVSDITDRIDALRGRFDLVVSWQVLEHVKNLDEALENARFYLCDGGRLLAQFSGTFSGFGIANRLFPSRLSVWAMKTLLRRDPETVFPAYYHHCWYGAIKQTLAPWTTANVIARNRAGAYFNFSRTLKGLVLRYENWIEQGNHLNLASHYLVDANR